MEEDELELIERRVKRAEDRLLAFPWKDFPPDRVKDLVADLRALLEQTRRRTP
jgi:hypothetical protein